MVVDAPATGLFVRGSEPRLVQVLRNLIGNAISFSPPNAQNLFAWPRDRRRRGTGRRR